MHFSSRQLVTLFLKPKFSVSMPYSGMDLNLQLPATEQLQVRGKRARMNDDGDGEVDENFWAQAAAEQAANREHDQDGEDSKSNYFQVNS